MFGTTMTTATDDELLVEVSLPSGLLEEIDQYARVHGYPTRSAVVASALQE
jgi:metal-responsive CopG/Arc/MetJ family transcriptional regulator